MDYVFDRFFHHTVTLLFLYPRQFLFLKKPILTPGRRWVIGLNYRITMLRIKYISIYALVMRSIHLQVKFIKKLPCGVMSQKSIFKHIVRNRHLHVMSVRKVSRVQVP